MERFNIDPSKFYKCIQTTTIAFDSSLENFIFNIFDPEGLKLFTRFRLGFSHLNENRFRHNFQECLNAFCICGLETRNSSHYLLHCHYNIPFRIDLTNSVKTFVDDFESLPGSKSVETHLYGDCR